MGLDEKISLFFEKKHFFAVKLSGEIFTFVHIDFLCGGDPVFSAFEFDMPFHSGRWIASRRV